MPTQIKDLKTFFIPRDIDTIRHDVSVMRDEAKEYKDSALASREVASASALAAQSYASDARQAAHEAAEWITLRNQGIHFGPTEPATRWDGMTWFMTDEEAHKIVSFRRWDANRSDNAFWPSDNTYPSDSAYPVDRGAWTDFSY